MSTKHNFVSVCTRLLLALGESDQSRLPALAAPKAELPVPPSEQPRAEWRVLERNLWTLMHTFDATMLEE